MHVKPRKAVRRINPFVYAYLSVPIRRIASCDIAWNRVKTINQPNEFACLRVIAKKLFHSAESNHR